MDEVSIVDEMLHRRLDEGVAVVTATRRLARHLQEEYARRQQAAGRKAWPTPEVRYCPDWLAEEWQGLPEAAFGEGAPVLLDDGQESLIWEQVLEGGLPQAYQGDRATLAAALKDAWARCREWQLDIAGFPRPASDEVELFVRTAGAFEKRLAEQGWINAAQLPEILIAAARGGAWRPKPSLWLGFDELTPAMRALRDALKEQGAVADIYAPAISAFPPSMAVVEMPAQAASAGEAVLFPCADESDEIRSAARWARALLENGEPGPIGVVFMGLGQKRGEVVRVFADVFGVDDTEPEAALNGLVHIALGRPLSEYPIVAHALLALEALSTPPDIETLSELLRSPFYSGGISEENARARLEVVLRKQGRERWPLPVLATAAEPCPVLSNLLNSERLAELMRDGSKSAAEWARWATQVLKHFGWPGERKQTSVEFQIVTAWHELLARYAGLSAVAEPMTMSEAVRRLGRMARERLFQPQSDPAPVQILGLPEIAGLRFSHLWIAGASDDTWPAAPRPNPFIPLTLQRQHGMPHADAAREMEFARRVSRALLAAAPTVIVSHAIWRDDEQLRISPLYASLPKAASADQSVYGGHARHLLATAPELETYSDWQAPPLGETRLKGGVGIVADQAACPFRAFALHRLFAEAPETVEAGLDAMTHGVLLHKAMAGIWNELKTHSALADLSLEALEKLISRCVDVALSKLDTHGDAFRRAVIEVERERLVRLIRDWLQFERQRLPFEVLETEFPQTLRIGGRELQLRADRIDRLESGQRLIIDYKTGKKKSANVWWGDRPDEPQLPMYALLEPPADAIALATLHAADSSFVGLANVPDLANGIHDSSSLRNDPIAWADLMEHWQRTVASLVENFAQGDARVDPKKPGTCTKCEVKPLCRLHELAPQDAFAENEETGDE